ncbi:GGDEF domain-containing protein [Virgisporangium aurantiacum]|nr:GGDEF domain-containing protein [Virgisporangium aurantiacum]
MRRIAVAVLCLFGAIVVVSQPTLTSAFSLTGLGCLAALAALWFVGYRRERFPPVLLPVEVTLLAVACFMLLDDTVGSLAAIALMLRCTYGGWRGGLAAAVAYLVAVTIGDNVGGPQDDQLAVAVSGLLWRDLPNFLVFGGIGIGLSAVLRGHERNVARDQVMLAAGVRLLAATTRDEIDRTVREAATDLLADTGARADPPEHTTLTAESRDRLNAGHPVRLSPAERAAADLPAGAAEAVLLDLAGRPVLLITSRRRLPAAAMSRLASLTTTAVLAARGLELREQLREQAYTDALTGLANRARFGEVLAAAVLDTRRTGRPAALLLLDLDGFKPVNDRLGHAAGDRLLQVVAHRLRAVVPAGSTVARLGGDEFVVLLTPEVGADRAGVIAGRVVDAIGAPTDLTGVPVTVGCSVGLAFTAPDGTGEAVLADADRAMYRAKAAGRNRVEVETAMVAH